MLSDVAGFEKQLKEAFGVDGNGCDNNELADKVYLTLCEMAKPKEKNDGTDLVNLLTLLWQEEVNEAVGCYRKATLESGLTEDDLQKMYELSPPTIAIDSLIHCIREYLEFTVEQSKAMLVSIKIMEDAANEIEELRKELESYQTNEKAVDEFNIISETIAREEAGIPAEAG